MQTYCPNDCGKCKGVCFYEQKNLKCSVCGEMLNESEAYEYRGSISCSNCLDRNKEKRDIERSEVMLEQQHKTDRFKGLDLSDSSIGKANKELLKSDIEIARKEGARTKLYEGR